MTAVHLFKTSRSWKTVVDRAHVRGDRFSYLDWMRGLAVVIMIQGHAFEGWLRLSDRGSDWFVQSQFLGGLPAPIFLFLAGSSMAIALDRMRQRMATASDKLLRVVKRFTWILFLAYAFRLEQFLVWYPWSHWSDVFRVDTLNCIAASTLLVGLVSTALTARKRSAMAMGTAAVAVIVVTPWVFELKNHLPSLMLDYLNSHGHRDYFSLFPWVAFAFAGASFGLLALEARSHGTEDRLLVWTAAVGVIAYAAGNSMKLFPAFTYGYFDYWLTSPHYLLIRLGWLSMILCGVYLWSRRARAVRWSPMRTFGRASLVIYWIHLEIVYGRPLSFLNHALSSRGVVLELVWFLPAMLTLAILWQRELVQIAVKRVWVQLVVEFQERTASRREWPIVLGLRKYL